MAARWIRALLKWTEDLQNQAFLRRAGEDPVSFIEGIQV
jgi:hypothetical protein